MKQPSRVEQLAAVCRREGLPLTVQRRVILELLAARADHPTAEQILDDVRARLPGVSRTTVYRVLETLVRVGLAVKTCHPGNAVRFDPKTERHHHLVCVQCEKVIDVSGRAFNSLRPPDTRASGFEVTDYSIYFRGLCAECRGVRPRHGHRARRGPSGERRKRAPQSS